jgi:hypothetical protein
MRRCGDEGQVTILVVIALAVFLLGFVGFAVDMTNMWFHRQMAQGAADAACQAGIMDVLLIAQGSTPPSPGFTPGTAFDCVASPAAVPCRYAALNGYDGTGLVVDTPSNQVAISFPGAVPGVTPPPASQAPVPFLRTDVVDRIGLTFASLITGNRTSDVRAFAECGLIQSKAPIPIIVLNPVCPHSYQMSGNPCVQIIGGPNKSIQVNSSNASAACSTNSAGCPTGSPGAACSGGGGSAAVDLSLAGPNFTGSRFGVWGGPGPGPGTFMSGFNGGTNGTWESPGFPIADPYASLPAPGPQGAPVPPPVDPSVPAYPACGSVPCSVPYHAWGCPDPAGCLQYTPGDYPLGIKITGATAIFDSGIYYITGDSQPASCSDPGTGCNARPTGNCHAALLLGSGSLVRPSNRDPSGIGGVMFYMSGSGGGRFGSVVITSNSGAKVVDPYVTAGANGVPEAVCPGTNPPAVGTPAELPATLQGNVLLGPCAGPYADLALDETTTPPTTYPIRGMLFFQDRANKDPNGQANFQGGGSMLLAGTMYFHNCPNSLTAPCDPWPTDYNAFVNLQGNPGSSTRVVGNIIADQLTMAGNGQISMVLDPNRVVVTIRASLLR